MSKTRKLFKILIKTFLYLLGFILLLVLATNLPPVQRFLSRQVANYMSNKLQTEVSVEGVYWRFPKYASIHKIYVEDQQKDTLLYANELRADLQLSRILKKELGIKSVLLNEATLDIHPIDSGSNLDFLVDAFSNPDTTIEKEADTTASAWKILFPDTRLMLADIDARYATPNQAFQFNVGELSLNADTINLSSLQFEFDELTLSQSDIKIQLQESDTTVVTKTDSSTLSLILGSKKIKFEQINFELEMPNMELSTYISDLAVDGTDFMMEESMDIAIQSFVLGNSSFKYDIPGSPRVEGFDPAHIQLVDIVMDITDASYHDLDIHASIQQLAAIEPKGMQLNDFKGDIHYNLDSIEVFNLNMATPLSSIQASSSRLTFPFVTGEGTLGDMKIRSAVEKAIFHPKDAVFFAPMLEDYHFMKQNKERTITLRANVDGKLDRLKIKQFDFNGWDTHLNCAGLINHPLETDQTSFDINASVIELNKQSWNTWLPPGTLPDFVELPLSTVANAKVRGFINDLHVDIEAQNTSELDPIASSINAQANIRDILVEDSLKFVVDIDSIYTTKSGLLSFLPTSVIPDYIDLPPEIKVLGQLEGSLQKINTDIQLYALRGGNFSYLNAVGAVSEFFGTNDPIFDISIVQLDLKEEEILAFLPKGILPPYIKIPSVRDAKGFVKGRQTDLNSSVDIITDVGTLQVRGFLKDSTYEVEASLGEFDIKKLFKEGEYEEVVGFPVSSFRASLFISGSGFNPDSNLLAKYKLSIKPVNNNYKWKEGINIEGLVDRQSGTINLNVDENGLKAQGRSLANFNAPNQSFDLNLDLQELDFRKLNLSALPFRVSGTTTADSEGSSLDSLVGNLRLDNWVIQYDSLKRNMDSLVLSAQLDTNLNKISVKSDFIFGNLDGKFKFDEIAGQIQQQAGSYFNPSIQLKDSIPGSKDAYLNLYFELDDPSILTMGYIPGLEAIEPCFMLGSFNASDKSLKLYSEVPYLKYSEFELDKLFFFFTSNKENLNYEVNFTDIFLYDQYQIHNVNLTGKAQSGRLKTKLNQRDTSFVERFDIEADIIKENDQFEIALNPEILLNYQKWNIKPTNRVLYATDYVNVIDWRLSFEEQYIELLNNELNTENLTFKIEQFDLNFIADLIKLNSQFVGGKLSGTIALNDIYDKLNINTDLDIESLHVMEAMLGDLNAKVTYDNEQKADINANLNGYGNDFSLNGIYKPDSLQDDLNLNLKLNTVNLNNLSPALTEYISLLEGQISGNLKIKGETTAPKLLGKFDLSQVSVRPNTLQTRFDLANAEVNLKEDGISIPSCQLRDSLGRQATFSANILTYDYQNFGLLMNFDAEDFLLLNTTREDNDLYYGKLIADVNAEIIGDFENPVISLDVKPEKGSDVTYIYSYGGLQSLETGDGVVEFISFDTVGQGQAEQNLLGEIKTGYGYDISINAEIDENLKFKVITDELAGDNFAGQGKGTLFIRMFPNNDIEINGQVAILNGAYLFSYSDVIRRTFEIKPNSYVKFNQNPYNPELNLTASYTTKTSPYPLIVSTLGGEGNVSEQDRANWEEKYQRQETFTAEVGVSGPLKEIELGTYIGYPEISGNSNSREIKDALNQLNQDESKTNTQAFSLILFNGFIAEDIGNSDGNVVDVQSGLGDLISDQLNNLANQYIKFVDIDFGIDAAGNSSGSLFEDSDFSISLKKSFLDDRLSVNVDGVASNSTEEAQSGYYLNNISIEYSLSKKGVLKVKVFNKREAEDVFNGDVVKIGGALLFSKDFDRLQLFNNKKEKTKK